jgi:O-antigen/teichoic acid export membrane protein
MSDFKKGALSSLILVGESILKKLIGLFSTLILARVLLPEDFGIVAIATIVIGFFQILSNTGSVQYLLKKDLVNESEINTSFTINLLIRGGLCFCMCILSFFFADWYDDQRLILLIIALSVVFIIQTFESPSLIYLKRAQDYGKIVKVSVVSKVFAVAVAVSIALVYESYWALVAGQATSACIYVIGSYLIMPLTPKLELTNARKQWTFSGWMIPQSILGYLRTQLDTILVSSTFGKSELGSYHTMKYLSFMPSAYLILPIAQTFLVELRKAKLDHKHFCKQFNASLILVLLLALPICGFLFQFHGNVVEILLGENWMKYSELLAALGFLIPASAIFHHCCRTIIVHDKPKHIFMYEIMSFTTLYGILFFIGLDNLLVFTYIRVGIENIMCLAYLLYVSIKYTYLSNSLKLIFGMLIISLCTCLSYYLIGNMPNLSTYLIIDFIAKSVCFFLIFYTSIIICHFLLLRRFSDWLYLESLIFRLTTPIFKKIFYRFK